jgi:hypothetical protein
MEFSCRQGIASIAREPNHVSNPLRPGQLTLGDAPSSTMEPDDNRLTGEVSSLG